MSIQHTILPAICVYAMPPEFECSRIIKCRFANCHRNSANIMKAKGQNGTFYAVSSSPGIV